MINYKNHLNWYKKYKNKKEKNSKIFKQNIFKKKNNCKNFRFYFYFYKVIKIRKSYFE